MTEQREYRVSWDIEVSASSPEDAVRLVVKWLEPKEPARWCYQVIDTEKGEVSKHEGQDLF